MAGWLDGWVCLWVGELVCEGEVTEGEGGDDINKSKSIKPGGPAR